MILIIICETIVRNLFSFLFWSRECINICFYSIVLFSYCLIWRRDVHCHSNINLITLEIEISTWRHAFPTSNISKIENFLFLIFNTVFFDVFFYICIYFLTFFYWFYWCAIFLWTSFASFVDRSNTFASCILTQYFFQRNLFPFIGIFLCHTSQIANVFFDPKPTLSTFLSEAHEVFSAFIAVFFSFFSLCRH